MNLRARIDLAVALAAVVASAGLGLLTWMDREDWRQHLPPRVLALLLIFLLLNRALHRLVRRPAREHSQALRRLALHDSLTGAVNRRGFMDRLAQAQQQQALLSLVMIDIDHFKRINDRHGHAAGDGVLREVAARLRRQMRGADLLGRLGGEEFALLLPATDLAGALAQAELARQALRREPMAIAGTVTASFGVAQWDGSESAADWLHRADLALYQAKRCGRDQVSLSGART
ncbi:diguanylate cyclase (GGDEF)-like protein [Sphaerotilus sulfidivorans]|uniref:diguanylate cyclase n=1 Tax=Sphaerotilus sulfidivorans TaxID=639200 RepID=A0A5C1PUN4_9BURK|nr:GGDEF domain-containing protein [Sphaerotilus sulfidivorans]NZD46054.1 GGDEF domain-containing protein [Sphaerotilus sulfidivorans]QEM99354.1 GGDEF domain-containing protein [Sphaerotilus sulfidivorans]